MLLYCINVDTSSLPLMLTFKGYSGPALLWNSCEISIPFKYLLSKNHFDARVEQASLRSTREATTRRTREATT